MEEGFRSGTQAGHRRLNHIWPPEISSKISSHRTLYEDQRTTQPPENPGHFKSSRPIPAVLALAAAAFFLLFGYAFVRSVSTSLYIDTFGAHRLPIVMALSAVGTFVFLYGYGWLLSRVGAQRTIFLTSAFTALGILFCYLAIRMGSHLALGGLYVLREAYIVILIEQYWSFIDSTLDSDQAKRWNGPICGIASIGAICGALVVGQFAIWLGTEQLLLFAAISLLPAGILSGLAYNLGGEPAPTPKERKGIGSLVGLNLFKQHRTLVILALLIAVTQVISTVLDLRFSGLLEEAEPLKDARTAYLGNFYAILNGTAFIFQFVVTPLSLRYLPMKLVHFAIPVLHIAAAAILLVHPTLTVGAGAYLLFKTLDYSIFRAGKEILYIPLPFDARYRSKEVIDSFIYRASKGVTSGFLALAGLLARLPGATYPGIAILSALGWIILVFRLF